MKSTLKQFGKTAVHGIVFGTFVAMTVSGIAYALTYNWSDPSALRNKAAGDVLSSSQWNLLVGNVDNLNERVASLAGIPTGTVIAFNGSACPNGWTAAAGSNVPTGSGGSSTLDLR
jgi:hypothetical protein